MGISHKYKFISISIPRTACGSIKTCIRPFFNIESTANYPHNHPYHIHSTALNLKVHFSKMDWDWNSYFKFVFVRNPWDRLVSCYHKFKPDVNLKYRWDNEEWDETSPMDFNEWIKRMDEPHFRPNVLHLTQLNFITDEKGDFLIDFIGKFENLEEDFRKVQQRIGITVELPHRNVSEHKNYERYYNKETRKIVATLFQRDIETFGYEY